jgi:hypothetical protein
LIKVDPAGLGPDEPEDWELGSQRTQTGQRSQHPEKLLKTTTVPQIDIMVIYTELVAAHSGDINALINACIQSTEDGLANSNVSASVNLLHLEETAYDETWNIVTDYNRLVNPADEWLDEIHDLRDEYGADVVVLLIDSAGGGYFGLANVEVNEADAFAVVVDNTAVGNYTFAHEVGHVIGGRHDNDNEEDPRAYAHGYKYSPAYWRTIMAVYDPYVYRINYWSNPDKTYGGVAMGTSNWNDNARVWDERASTVAGFRTAILPLTVYISGNDCVQNKGNSVTLTANPGGGDGQYTYYW